MTIVTVPYMGETASYLVSEAANIYRSREEGVVASGSGVCPAGMIMAKLTTTGEYVPFVTGGANGAGTASAILWERVDATSAPVRVTLSVRDTEVHRAKLVFSGSPTTPQKNAAYASLATLGFAFR